MRAAIVLVAVLASAGCLRKTEYKCSDSTDCGAGGTCEPVGFCSFADTGCDSGRRFGEFSGSTYAGQCVGDQQMGPDSGTADGQTTDGQMGACPATYTVQSGSHFYRVITTKQAWMDQKTACAADGPNMYLAVPDDQAELTAIFGAAPANEGRFWVGIEDPQNNSMFVSVLGAAYPLDNGLWDTLEPDNKPETGNQNDPADCGIAVRGTSKVADDRCSSSYVAVCECEP